MKMLLVLAALLTAPAAFAKSSLKIDDARIYTPMTGAVATAGYGKLTNTSDKTIKVEIAKVAPFKAVELHETLEKDGRMAMQKVESFSLKKGESLELKPGAHHIMLFEPQKTVKDGEILKVELKIDGKSETFDFKTVPRVQKKEEHHHH